MYLDEVYSALHTWYPPYTSFFKQNCDTFSTEIKHFPDKRCFNFCSFPVTFQQGIIKNNVTGKKKKITFQQNVKSVSSLLVADGQMETHFHCRGSRTAFKRLGTILPTAVSQTLSGSV